MKSLDSSSLAQLDRFLECRFLGSKLMKLSKSTGQEAPIFRHYVHEASRTSGFLVGHSPSKRCVVIDPIANIVDAIERDIRAEGLEIVAVCLTHAFFDVVVAHEQLLAAFPQARLVAGEKATIHVSPPGGDEVIAMSLEAYPAPAYSSDALVFALRIGSNAACFFTGPTWPLDALPRLDLAMAEEGISSESAMTRAYKTLVGIRGLMFSPDTASDPIIFPSHGGYNNCTNQLDLHWAAPVSSLSRTQHTRQLLAALDSYDAFHAHMTGAALALPSPPLFHFLRWLNGSHVSKRLTIRRDAISEISVPLIDVRSTDEYCERHVAGSVNFPMTFPGTKVGSKKAELWLSCFLPIPSVDFDCQYLHLRACVMCSTAGQAIEVRQRMGAIGIGGIDREGHKSSLDVIAADTFDWSTVDVVTLNDRSVTIDENGDNDSIHRKPRWMRLNSHGDLHALDVPPGASTLVVDCRTPYEFKNGSHRSSAHVPLAELCTIVGTLLMLKTAPDGVGSNAKTLLDAFVETVLVRAGIVHPIDKFVLYCAAGYRSHIAVSLFQMLLERLEGRDTKHRPVVRDVVGGALRVMTLRPDLWQVKDRSIVCIS